MAILFSLMFPGFGHFHLGRRKISLFFFISALLLLFSIHFISGEIWYVYFLNYIALWVLFVLSLAHVVFLVVSSAPRSPSYSWGTKLLVLILLWSTALASKHFSTYKSYSVPAGSMLPLIVPGDVILAKKTSISEVKRGDIIVFKKPDNETVLFIKRVIALGGETIEIRRGEVVINQKILDRELFDENSNPIKIVAKYAALDDRSQAYIENNQDSSYTVINNTAFEHDVNPNTVPEGRLYVLGDHRSNSLDSRIFGYISEKHIVGKAKYIIYTMGKEKFLSRSGKDL